NIAEGLSGTALGISAGATAAFSYAVSHVYAKKFVMGQRAFVAPTAQLIASAILIIPFALWYDQPFSLPFPSLTAIGGVLGLIILGTVSAFIIYYKLLEVSGPTAVSTVACFFPVVGMFLGFFFLGESLSFVGLIAASLIFIGLMTVNDLIPLG